MHAVTFYVLQGHAGPFNVTGLVNAMFVDYKAEFASFAACASHLAWGLVPPHLRLLLHSLRLEDQLDDEGYCT